MNTKVSIVIITKNRANFIAKAIESVLKQTFSDWELLIIDDDSSDNTESIVKENIAKDNRIKYVKNSPSLGISKSRNLGVSLSKGEYIAMLDSDDYWIDENKLKKQIDILDGDSSIGLVGSAMLCVNENEKILSEAKPFTNDTDIRKKMLIDNQIYQSSVVFRKKAFEEVGGYDEKMEVAEDYDLWLRIGKKYKFANLKESTIHYTIHSNNVSKSKKKMAIFVDKITEKYKNDYPGYFLAKTISILRLLKTSLGL